MWVWCSRICTNVVQRSNLPNMKMTLWFTEDRNFHPCSIVYHSSDSSLLSPLHNTILESPNQNSFIIRINISDPHPCQLPRPIHHPHHTTSSSDDPPAGSIRETILMVTNKLQLPPLVKISGKSMQNSCLKITNYCAFVFEGYFCFSINFSIFKFPCNFYNVLIATHTE